MNKIFVRFFSIFLSAFVVSGFIPHLDYSPISNAKTNDTNVSPESSFEANLPIISYITEAPSLVYRADRREPAEIFEIGFQVPGKGINENIMDHVRAFSLRKAIKGLPEEQRQLLEGTTNFVSTASTLDSASNFLPNLLDRKPEEQNDPEGWVYVIEPDENFFSVNNSIKNSYDTGERSLAETAKKYLEVYNEENEWVAKGGIPRERIIGAIPNKAINRNKEVSIENNIIESFTGIINNDKYYTESSTKPSVDPFPITESSYFERIKANKTLVPAE